MILKVLTWPKDANILHQVSKDIEFKAFLHPYDFPINIDNMIETMYYYSGYGLSAIQVGIPLRVFVMDNPKSNEARVFINPEITDLFGGMELMDEGCLSFPGIFEKVNRYKNVTVKYLDRKGNQQIGTFSGLDAQCIQHEIEHFNGIIMADKVSSLKRNSWKKKLK